MKFYRSNDQDEITIVVSKLGVPPHKGAVEELTANTVDAVREKHVPVIENAGYEVTVTVGDVIHPMTDAHYIMWIAIETKEGFQIKHLTPDMTPTASFHLTEGDTLIAAYEYCNLHGLWKAAI
jgi:desulfoferrodoxin ferrous iron-binding domain